MKYIIDDIVTSFTNRISSHRSAWPRMQKCMIDKAYKTDTSLAWDNQDAVHYGTWLVSTPMEFNGDAFNLFGGYNQEVKNRIARVLDFDFQFIKAIEKPLPDIETILRPRAIKTGLDFTDKEWAKIRNLQYCSVIRHEDMVDKIDRVVIGDSHSISRYALNTIVYRHDGLTMHGLVSRGISSYLPSYNFPHLVINVGNVDIRHHLARQTDPIQSTIRLVTELKIQLEQIKKLGFIESYEVTTPYPIEFTGRRIPKTGYYKGTPFFGTWSTRNEIRQIMHNEMLAQFDNVYQWPEEWYVINPEEYAKRFMEKPQSVHLSPEFYQWDLVNNIPNNRMLQLV